MLKQFGFDQKKKLKKKNTHYFTNQSQKIMKILCLTHIFLLKEILILNQSSLFLDMLLMICLTTIMERMGKWNSMLEKSWFQISLKIWCQDTWISFQESSILMIFLWTFPESNFNNLKWSKSWAKNLLEKL